MVRRDQEIQKPEANDAAGRRRSDSAPAHMSVTQAVEEPRPTMAVAMAPVLTGLQMTMSLR